MRGYTMSTEAGTYPTAQDLVRMTVLHYFGKAMKQAQDEAAFSLKRTLLGIRRDFDSFFMQEPMLRFLDSLGDKTFEYGRTNESVARDLQEVIRRVLAESGDAKLLANNGLEIQVIVGEIQGYPGRLWARFAPSAS